MVSRRQDMRFKALGSGCIPGCLCLFLRMPGSRALIGLRRDFSKRGGALSSLRVYGN